MNQPQKVAVSISEMARMVGLSRQRFHQLKGITFPEPRRDPETNRPFYDEELQQVCLDVRRRNCGIDGQPVLFYSPRHPLGQQSKPVRKPKAKPKQSSQYSDLMAGLDALGLSATAAQVEAAVKQVFPDGIQNLNSGEVIRAVFLQLKRQELG
ncbi:hypothetical protein LOC67_20145 [Stieleria sp. JC731]|uniref:hypothetical protein n=1 Tax=Pirellulaceae TaxID=2691357 RepID=UPI001E289903|nr:hypothetical protein [Stieleria sp. JC731]MCC9602868.1 hypothetical protein [Stieleria sp. JC731]